ncbi:hypothetical protein [Bailinhaonella thermotolerans]|uniref:Uncharacterized protein n=1 Tax=Bailinhaonella thermotolerans TaxID=1070861 RepID=A0A3A4A2X3_9ACTN|nr:hypothetical protein [Bailinhaonella thermotolerans]RJL21060.1 hypothetical protein D5H75_38245 [Bailinhaonella thermotolerans]
MSYFDALPCGAPTVATVGAGCVHEHVDTLPLCADCLALLEAGEVMCGPCGRAGHTCPIQPLPASGSHRPLEGDVMPHPAPPPPLPGGVSAAHLAAAVAEGERALWEAVRRHFPAITGGDLPPELVVELDQALTRAVAAWVRWNADPGGA